MAYKQRGIDFGNGDPTNPPLSSHETKKGTVKTDVNKRESIIDLNDRIGFLKGDLEEAKAPAKKASLNAQIKELQAALAKLKQS